MQATREADVPRESRIEKPESGVDRDHGGRENRQPLLRRIVAEEQRPHEAEAGDVERGVQEIEVREMRRQQAPELVVFEAGAVIAQQQSQRLAGQCQRENTDANRRQRAEARSFELQELAPMGDVSRNLTDPILLSFRCSYTRWLAGRPRTLGI